MSPASRGQIIPAQSKALKVCWLYMLLVRQGSWYRRALEGDCFLSTPPSDAPVDTASGHKLQGEPPCVAREFYTRRTGRVFKTCELARRCLLGRIQRPLPRSVVQGLQQTRFCLWLFPVQNLFCCTGTFLFFAGYTLSVNVNRATRIQEGVF